MPLVKDVEKAHGLALNLAAQRYVLAEIARLETEAADLYAKQLTAFAELGRLSAERPSHAVMEIAGTARIGQDKSKRLIEHGRRLVELYPQAKELLHSGALCKGTVELLLWITKKATDEVQAELGQRVISQLVGCDAVDARALIVAALLEVEADLEPEAAQRKQDQARANRGVWVKPVEDGMARIGAEVDAVSAQRFALDLEELTRAQGIADTAAGTERTKEQRRADVLAELPGKHLALLRAFQQSRTSTDLLGPDVADEDVLVKLCALKVRAPVTLYVHTPMSTLLDLDNRSGYVEGYGPISAHQARLLRPVAALQALWVDGRTGVPLGIDPTVSPPVGEPDWDDPGDVSRVAEQVRERLRTMLRSVVIDDTVEPRRTPSAALSRLVEVRDIRCTGPGCPLPASRCEQDHLVAVAEGGQTAVWSLALKSPRCHHARHDGWTSTRLETGETVWRSPLGGEYVRRSPWRPSPPIRKPVAPATLDRPGGDCSRTFGEPADQPPAAPGSDAGATRKVIWFDAVGRTSPAPEQGRPPKWDRPWPTDDAPPF